MQKKLIQIITKIFIITSLIMLLAYSSVFAKESLPETLVPYCMLVDLDSGAILYNKNAYEQIYPASTTKIMTAIVVLENCKMDEMVPISHYSIFSVPIDYSNANLQEGELLSVQDLLYALLLPSANDAAFALAQYVGSNGEKYLTDGSNEAKEQFERNCNNFYDMMNAEATNLGCKNTHFVNPNGIHAEDHYTTTYDLSLIAQKAMTYDIFRKIVATTTYTLPSSNVYPEADRFLKTTNTMLDSSSKYYYQYTNGIKTGYTAPAQHCIVISASKDDVNLLAVVMHGENLEDGFRQREADCLTLFEYGFSNYSKKAIAHKDDVEKTILVKGATFDTMKLNLVLDDDLKALLPNDFDLETYTPNIRLDEDIKAPIAAGKELGTITYTINNIDYVGRLVAQNEVKKLDVIKLSMIVALSLILFLTFITIIHRIKRKKKRKRGKREKSDGYNPYRTNPYYRKR